MEHQRRHRVLYQNGRFGDDPRVLAALVESIMLLYFLSCPFINALKCY